MEIALLRRILILVLALLALDACRTEPPQAEPPQTEVETAPVVTLPVWHVVQAGDSLYSVSQRYYGTGMRWQEIHIANQWLDPAGLQVGDRLLIPALDGESPAR